MARLGAIVGLPIEATILRLRCRSTFTAPDWVAVARADAARAEFLSDGLVARGANALLSFGIAGGTDPALRPGAIVVATEIVFPDGRRAPADASWRRAVLAQARGLNLYEAPIGGSDRMVVSLAEKRRWRSKAGVAAVDMESHGMARTALRHAVPLLAIRAIADPADRALPPAATAGLAADGTVRPLGVLSALFAEPRQIPQLLGLSANVLAALTALWRVAVAVSGPAR
jgi:hopanoid-associated phosphorylase